MSWYNIKAQANGSAAEITIKGTIGRDIPCEKFISELSEITASEVTLNINSDGGSVIDGFAIYDAIVAHPAKFTANIYRLAGSMATIVVLACGEVVIAPNAFVMIHSPLLLAVSGHSEDLRDYADLLDKFGGRMAEIYAERMGMSAESVADIMSKDTWWTAQDAVSNGFADRISATVKPVGHANFEMLAVATAPAAIHDIFNKPSAQKPEETQTDKNKGKPMNEAIKKKLVAMGIQAELTEETIDSLLTKCTELQTELKEAKEEIAEKDKEVTEEQARVEAVLALGNKHGLTTEAVAAIKAKTSLADFTAQALDAVAAKVSSQPTTQPLNVPAGAVASGSGETLESLRAQIKGMPDGAERHAILAKITTLRDGK